MALNTKSWTLLVVVLGLAFLSGLSWILLNWIGTDQPAMTPALRESLATLPNDSATPNLQITSAERFQDVKNVPQGLFSYGGATSWAPIRQTVDQQIMKAFPEFQLRYLDPPLDPIGTTAGLDLLLADQLTFLQSSQSLESSAFQSARDRGFRLQQIPVAIDSIVFVVSPELNLTGLNLEQIRQIYRGEITNWQQVGGPNLSIQPLARSPESGGTVQEFQRQILNNQSFVKAVTVVPTTTQAIRQLQNTPGGIYFASGATVLGQCNVKSLPISRRGTDYVAPYQLPYVPTTDCPEQRNRINADAMRSGNYPLTRQLFVVIKQNGLRDQTAGLAYVNLLLTNEAQQEISEAGYVNLY